MGSPAQMSVTPPCQRHGPNRAPWKCVVCFTGGGEVEMTVGSSTSASSYRARVRVSSRMGELPSRPWRSAGHADQADVAGWFLAGTGWEGAGVAPVFGLASGTGAGPGRWRGGPYPRLSAAQGTGCRAVVTASSARAHMDSTVAGGRSATGGAGAGPGRPAPSPGGSTLHRPPLPATLIRMDRHTSPGAWV
jgi:hypothetical protein